MTHRLRAPSAALLALALVPSLGAQSKSRPQPYLIEDVRLTDAEDAPAVSLLLRNGRIAQVMDDPRPELAGVWRIDGAGGLVTPAFVDAFSNAAVETPEPPVTRDAPVDVRGDVRVDMREANRKGLQPALSVVDVMTRDDKEVEKHRKAGFGAVLHAPTGQLLGGRSALVTTRDAALRDALHADSIFLHADWAATGDGYPVTPMGFMAQLRQFFLDADYLALRRERYAQGRPDPRPPFDEDLAAVAPVLGGEQRLACEASGLGPLERWLALGREFDLQLAIVGGNDSWQLVDELADGEFPVLLTLDWGEEVEDPHEGEEEEAAAEEGEGAEAVTTDADDGASDEPVYEYEEPLGVREERRRRWEETRDCAIRLADAGVPFAFGSAEDKPGDLVGRVRDLVEAGLDREVAMNALTHGAASILGAGDRLGKLEPGYDATVAIWTKHPLDEKAKLAVLVVDGFPYEFEVEETGKPGEGVDASGAWELELDTSQSPNRFLLTIEMAEDGSVTGTMVDADDQEGDAMDVEGHVDGSELSLSGTANIDGLEIDVKLDLTLDGDSLAGSVGYRSEHFDSDSKATGTRTSTPEEN